MRGRVYIRGEGVARWWWWFWVVMGFSGRLIAFPWFGGKFLHVRWILSLLPRCRHYCEPFGGAGSVLLNRDPSPIETFNDIDSEVVNFFKVLRDDFEELVRVIKFTPYSREEFEAACEVDDSSLDRVERARRFYIRARQSIFGLGQVARRGDWGYSVVETYGGMAGRVSKWVNSIDILYKVADRLRRVQLENRLATWVIRLYDTPDTLFYCDPPYIGGRRGGAYRYEMSYEDHVELARLLNSVRGRVAISGFSEGYMDELYSSPKWYKSVYSGTSCIAHKVVRFQALWTNYDPKEVCRQGSLF